MIRIQVPATSANLGPGFDCLGLALELYNSITVDPGRPFGITLSGPYQEGIPTDESNLVWQTMCHLWRQINFPIPSVTITLENHIPPARGLGSSSAAIVGGLVAANALAGSPLTQLELLQVANILEGHPDNVTPALYGGVTLSVETAEGVIPRVLHPAPALRAVLVIPDLLLKTAKARGILSPEVSRKDAVFNIAHTALLVEAFIREDFSLLRESMRDMLHQPQRATLIPGMNKALESALEVGAYGSALSGSGPTLIALTSRSTEERVTQVMLNQVAEHGLKVVAMSLDIATKGTTFSIIR